MLNTNTCYYVYFHRRNDTNEIFYVGKGKGDRAFNTNKRTKIWEQTCKDAGGAYVEIFRYNLTENEAIDLEAELINKYLNQIVNFNNNSKIVQLTEKSLNELYYYDETSPTCLRWKVESGRGRTKREVGSVAGYVDNKSGYCRVYVDGKMLLVHRVIWTMLRGNISSKFQINHIDNNPSNNRIDNLEVTTVKQNNNLKKKKDAYKIIKKNNIPVSIQVTYLNDNLNRCFKNFKIDGNIEETIKIALNFKRKNLEEVDWKHENML